ncbi:MAG: hypothetical protein II486_02210, partial [Thermoguttaceae bacterium]|nr:hypothetical protein [Thermoguttaceae bacterium]
FNEKTGAFVASWGDGSDGEDGYLIEASTDGGATWTAVAQAGADATRASVSGAGLTGSFTLRVSAYNGAGASDYAYAQVWNLTDYAAYKAFALTSPAEGTVVLNGVNKDGSYTALETRELGADFYACVLGRKLTPEDFCIASDAAARLGRIDFVDPVRNNTVSVDAGDGDDLILIGSEVIETTEQIFTQNPYEKVLQYNAERFGEDSALYQNLKAKLDEAYAKMAKIVKTTKTTWGTVSIEGGANVRFIGASSVSVNAGAGDDVVKIDSLRFNYVVTGGEGSDTLSFADASGRANVDLGLTDVWQAAVVGDGGLVKLTDAFEGVVGTVYGDRIVASAKGATVVGNGGADSVTLVGGMNDVQLVGKGQSVIARGSGVYNITLTDANYSTVNVAGVRKESAVTVDVDGDYFTFFGGPSAFDAQIDGDYAIVNGGAALQANVDILGDHATVTTGQGADSVRIVGDYAIANVGAGSDAVEIVGANANVALGLGDDVLTVSDGASGRVGGS